VEPPVTLGGGDAAAGVHLDIPRLFNAAYEVRAHALAQAVASDDDVHPAGTLAHEDGSLPRTVAAADDDHFPLAAQQRLGMAGGVVEAVAFEPLEPFPLELAVVGAGGDDEAVPLDLPAVGEGERAGALAGPVAVEADDIRQIGQHST